MNSSSGTASRDAAITLDNVSHQYGSKRALTSVSFQVEPGQFVALLGPNGAGKTTIFSLLTRLLRPTEGCIRIFGQDLNRHSSAALARVGVVFQQPTLDLDLTVAQNLAYHGAIQGMPPKRVRERISTELARFSLEDTKDSRVRSLNGGHRRRVELARSLLHEPDVLLLDEATAGLDVASRTALYRHVRSLVEERNVAVLWTTHLVEELSPDDHAIILQRGEIKGQGHLRELVKAGGFDDASALVLSLTEPNT